MIQHDGNRPPEECSGPWYVVSGHMNPVGGEPWLCEVHGAGHCPESSQWTKEVTIIAQVPAREIVTERAEPRGGGES